MLPILLTQTHFPLASISITQWTSQICDMASSLQGTPQTVFSYPLAWGVLPEIDIRNELVIGACLTRHVLPFAHEDHSIHNMNIRGEMFRRVLSRTMYEIRLILEWKMLDLYQSQGNSTSSGVAVVLLPVMRFCAWRSPLFD